MEAAMTATTNREPISPALWESEYIETRVLEITGEQFGYAVAELSLDSRPGQDIGGDSLDMVEYIMALETEFQITISDQMAQEWFTHQPMTIRNIVAMVRHLQGTAQPDRSAWTQPRSAPPGVEVVPFTQLGDRLNPRHWFAGRLYEPFDRNREGYLQYRRSTDGMRCVPLPAGEAWIGSSALDVLPDQRPAHPVELSSFLIDAEPVSNAAYARFLNSVGPIPPSILAEWCLVDTNDRRERFFPLRRSWWRGWRPVPGTEHQPVILMTWYGANAYSLWANRRDWRLYRGDGTIPAELQDTAVDAEPPPSAWLSSFLPSEAQWEYACRGTDARRYPWGDDPPTPERLRVACHVVGAAYTLDTLPAAHVSQRLGMSPFGLHHMAGNVWQWCRDWYAADFYHRAEAHRNDPQNGRPTGIRSERGGSWVGPAQLACSSSRRGRPPRASGRCLGFRCVGLVRDLP
jgi:formylglycine-generating enzyme